jgi:amino acid transporter
LKKTGNVPAEVIDSEEISTYDIGHRPNHMNSSSKNRSSNTGPSGDGKKGSLGTFAGVFTPSILTILGIILFLRLGFVLGHAGLPRALLIIGLANAISVLTSLSLAAVATNLRVKGGGDYYLISRTLGVAFGGSIGIVLFLAQSVSIAFYCIGFSEAVTALAPEGWALGARSVAIGAVCFLFIFSWLGADWATRLQYVIMAVLILALGSFFVGGLGKWSGAIFEQSWRPLSGGPSFWILFAIFFPAVTGFTQGVSMSGDLKDPGKSLPLGTFLAVGLSIFVYFSVTFVFAGAMPADTLSSDFGAMRKTAAVGFLIDAGVIGATLSSAMASFLGAPRILQSMAKDRIFKTLRPFEKGVGPSDNPRRGVLLSFGIALCTVSLGELNLIAPIVSMFFLISYGLLNYATFYEARASSPSFRPRFRWFDKRLSLIGCLTCLAAMLAIDLRAGVMAVAILFAVYQYLNRKSGPSRWADSTRSYHLQQLRGHLIAAASEPEHPRDWRPQLLAVSNDTDRRAQLLRFGSWILGGSGVMTAVCILEGKGVKMLKAREEAVAKLEAEIVHDGLNAFPLVMIAPSLEQGIQGLVQAYGVGPLKANTMILNWMGALPERIFAWKEKDLREQLRTAFRLGCNILLLDAKEDRWQHLKSLPGANRRIDVWWLDDKTGHLILLLAHLMTRSDAWRDATIRVIGIENGSGETEENLKNMLNEARIDAQTKVVPSANQDVVAKYSHDATMVFLPFRLGSDGLFGPFGGALKDLLPQLPIAALVQAAEDIDLDAEPEEGVAGDVAAALDAVSDSQERSKEAEQDALKAVEEVKEKERELKQAISGREDPDIVARLREKTAEAKKEAEKATRRAAKAKTKADDAVKEAEALGLLSKDAEEVDDK